MASAIEAIPEKTRWEIATKGFDWCITLQFLMP